MHYTLLRGRSSEQLVVFGSFPAMTSPVWSEWRKFGYEVMRVSRTSTTVRGAEHPPLTKINETLIRFRDAGRTLVLFTGDGNDGGRATFKQTVELALSLGWKVEVHALARACSNVYKRFQKEYAETGRFKVLPITFLK